MRRVVVLTGADLRHRYFRKALGLAEGVDVVRTYAEGLESSLRAVVEGGQDERGLQLKHLEAREHSERDFFEAFDLLAHDRSMPVAITRGSLNEKYGEIIELAPDVLIAYGCSIIREPLLSAFKGKFVNLHLGLSPYYRGSGTNFWPLVRGEPEYVGVTFMHIDAGIDTGEIIHQIRPVILPDDGPHQIGNRLIKDMAFVCADLIRGFDRLVPMRQPSATGIGKVFRKRDFTPEATQRLYDNFRSGMIPQYLTHKAERLKRASMIENPALTKDPQ